MWSEPRESNPPGQLGRLVPNRSARLAHGWCRAQDSNLRRVSPPAYEADPVGRLGNSAKLEYAWLGILEHGADCRNRTCEGLLRYLTMVLPSAAWLSQQIKLVGAARIELATAAMSMRCSTGELRPKKTVKLDPREWPEDGSGSGI